MTKASSTPKTDTPAMDPQALEREQPWIDELFDPVLPHQAPPPSNRQRCLNCRWKRCTHGQAAMSDCARIHDLVFNWSNESINQVQQAAFKQELQVIKNDACRQAAMITARVEALTKRYHSKTSSHTPSTQPAKEHP